MQQSPLLSAEQIAKQLNISRAMAYKLLQSGEIRSIRIGRAIRSREEFVDEFLKRNELCRWDQPKPIQ